MNVQLEDLKYWFSEFLIKNFGKELAKGDTAAIEEIIDELFTNHTFSTDITNEFPNITSFQQFLIWYFNEIGFKFKLNLEYFGHYLPCDWPGAKKNSCLYNIKLSPEYIEGLDLKPYQFYEWAGLKEIILPDNLSEIPSMCFGGCLNLEKVTLPSQLKIIGIGAFHFCRSLTEIDLPEGLSIIEFQAFKLCVNLKTVKLPHSLTSIGNFAFPWNRSDRDKFESKEIQVYYNGTIEEWDKISKGRSSIGFPESIGLPEVICKDGTWWTNF